MLLIQIIICIFAVLMPEAARWPYFTLITILCLCKIYTGDWRTPILLVVSTVLLILHGVFSHPKLESISEISFNIDKACYVSVKLTGVGVLVGENGGYLLARPCNDSSPADISVVAVKSARALGYGSWQERRFFAEGAKWRLDIVTPLPSHFIVSDLSDYSRGEALTRALIFGEKSAISQQDKWLIRHLGIAHLFVVSGLHIGFAWMLSRFISRLIYLFYLAVGRSATPLPQVLLEAPLGILACAIYGYMSGWGEPVIRAFLMVVLWGYWRSQWHRVTLFGLLQTAVLLMLWWQPYRIVNASFWLSVSFILLLVILLPRLGKSYGWYHLCLLLFSLFLTAGWQESQSLVALLTNMVLVPVTGFIWLPSAVAVLLIDNVVLSSHYYHGIGQMFGLLWHLAAWGDSVSLNTTWGEHSKLLLVIFAYGLVLLMPLWRARLGLILLMLALIDEPNSDLMVENRGGDLLVRANGKVVELGSWQALPRRLTPSEYFPNAIIAQRLPDYSAGEWLRSAPKWVLTRHATQYQTQLLAALKIPLYVVQTNETLHFRANTRKGIEVSSSLCPRGLKLFATSACKRVAALESVVN
ncbi:ComEC/Rec2 family competence protein [Maribrevibacterium harenarium]|uniref:ComEC/Rec2 family competence protein n=1 Tax=Maribrevibacterium harenarium TaxID=2589817 RepID=A0A501X4L4_9GAMM|nr:ComEC/Rec2 family competence protein [Maribrevibacterium harenarium]TPE55490.1 ComEC/Rec2 family competence protein [Maribrevibacterium harenarium]